MKFLIISILLGFIYDPVDVYLTTVLTNNSLAIDADSWSFLTAEEIEMIHELNNVRANPLQYVDFVLMERDKIIADSARLSELISETIKKKHTYQPDGSIIVTEKIEQRNYYESKMEAVDELITDLINSPHLNILEPQVTMYNSAVKHANLQIERGYIEHYGVDGSWPLDRMKKEASWIEDGNENIARGTGGVREIVLQLLIDSGVPGRGHRTNILNPDWKYVACYKVAELSDDKLSWWIQEFAR